MQRYAWGDPHTVYRYTGQREEDDLDFYHYGARWYDPVIGRFASPDSIIADPGDPQALNRYSYVTNNPLRYSDPTGYCQPDDTDCLAALAEIEEMFGITIDDSDHMWNILALNAIREGMSALAGAMAGGLDRFRELFGGIRFARSDEWTYDAAKNQYVGAYFDYASSTVFFTNEGVAEEPGLGLPHAPAFTVHELAHAWDASCGDCWSLQLMTAAQAKYELELFGIMKLDSVGPFGKYVPGDEAPTEYAKTDRYEDWAESLRVTIYPQYIQNTNYPSSTRDQFVRNQLNSYWPGPW